MTIKKSNVIQGIFLYRTVIALYIWTTEDTMDQVILIKKTTCICLLLAGKYRCVTKINETPTKNLSKVLGSNELPQQYWFCRALNSTGGMENHLMMVAQRVSDLVTAKAAMIHIVRQFGDLSCPYGWDYSFICHPSAFGQWATLSCRLEVRKRDNQPLMFCIAVSVEAQCTSIKQQRHRTGKKKNSIYYLLPLCWVGWHRQVKLLSRIQHVLTLLIGWLL